MGTQKRFVLISVLGIVLVIAGLSYLTYRMIYGSRLAGALPWGTRSASSAAEASENGRSSGSHDRQLVDLSIDVSLDGVERVYVRGGWDVRIAAGSAPSLSVKATERHLDRVIVDRDGTVLELRVADNTNYSVARFQASLVLPELEGVEVVGLANVEFDGLDADEFEVDVEGAANVIARDCRFTNLELSLEGAGNIDFSESPTVNASVDVAGLANVTILIDGGVLDGTVEGLGRVSYSGTVSEQRIETDGGFLRAVDEQDD